jgi:hypothetical protein
MRKADSGEAMHAHVRIDVLEDALGDEDQADGDSDEHDGRSLSGRFREEESASGIHTCSADARRGR